MDKDQKKTLPTDQSELEQALLQHLRSKGEGGQGDALGQPFHIAGDAAACFVAIWGGEVGGESVGKKGKGAAKGDANKLSPEQVPISPGSICARILRRIASLVAKALELTSPWLAACKTEP